MAKIIMSEERYEELTDEQAGICLSCEEEVYGVEPDARCYECEHCGAPKVYGVEELLMMGRIEFGDDEDEDEGDDFATDESRAFGPGGYVPPGWGDID